MAVVKNLMVRAGADFSGMRNEMAKAQKSMTDFQKNTNRILKGIGAGLAALGIGKGIKDSINAASELEGAMLGLQSILEGQGRSFGRANQFIQEYINDGLVPLTDAVAAYKNLAARGYDDEQIKNVMNRLKDAAAFGRQSSYSLGEAVSSATEGLKNENSMLVDNAGVTKNVAKMWDEYARSIGTNTNQLTQQQKILAEVNGIMDETRFQVGDAAKYTDTFAGRLAALNKTMSDVRVNLGQAFIPIANLVLPLLQALANKLAYVTAYIAQFTQALFGKSQTSQVQSQSKATNQQAVAVGNLGSAIKKTSKEAQKAKKAQGSLAGFDEINSLADKTESGSGADGGGAGDLAAGGAGLIDTTPINFETNAPEIGGKVKEMTDKVRGIISNMKNFLAEHKDIIVSVLGGLAAGFATFLIASNLSKIKSGFETLRLVMLMVGDAITKGLKAAFAFLATPVGIIVVAVAALTAAFIYFYRTNEKFKGFVDGVLDKIKDAAIWLWKNALVPLGEYLAKGFTVAWEAVKKAAEWVWKNVFIPFGDFLLGFWKNVISPLGKVLIDVLATAFNILADVAKFLWVNVLKPLGEFLVAAFKPTIEALSAVFTFLWNNVLVPLGKFIGESFKSSFTTLTTVIQFLWNNVLKPLVDFLAGAFSLVFNKVFENVGDLVKGLQKTFVGLMTFITGVFTGDWKKAWEGVKQIFKGVFDGLYAIVKTPLNMIIDAINTVIGALNSISINIPDWVPGVGGKTFGINIPKIPKLARGGIVDGATNFGNYIAGEAGAEMIVPLENTSFVDKLASALGTAVMSAMHVGTSNQQSNGDVVIQLEGATLARVMNPYLERERGRIGSTIIQTT